MKYIITIVVSLFLSQIGKSQEPDKEIYLGIYTGGFVMNLTKLTPPYHQNLWWYNFNFYPKIGYYINRKVTMGLVGQYSFFNSQVGNAKPLHGGGYFIKYDFRKRDTATRKQRFVYFIEWQQLFSNGYYILDTDIKPQRVSKPINNLILQFGIDFKIFKKKNHYLSLSYGIGNRKFYKNYLKPEEGERTSIQPFGLLTYHYNFKTKK